MVSLRDFEPKNSKKPLALDDIKVLQLHCTYIRRIKVVHYEVPHNNSIICFGGLKSPLLHIEMYHKKPQPAKYWKFKLNILTGKLNHLLNAPPCGWMVCHLWLDQVAQDKFFFRFAIKVSISGCLNAQLSSLPPWREITCLMLLQQSGMFPVTLFFFFIRFLHNLKEERNW